MVDWKKNLRIESISNILRTKALCWSWYARIGVSDFPDGPTVNLVAAYLNAIDKATFAPIYQRKKESSDKSRSEKCNATYHTATSNADSTTQ